MKTIKKLIFALMVIMISAISNINAQGITACRGVGDTIVLHGGVEPYTWVMDSTFQTAIGWLDTNIVFPKVITFNIGSTGVPQSIPQSSDYLAVSGFPIYITDSIGDTLTIYSASELQYPIAIITSQNESSSLYCDGLISTQLNSSIQSYWIDSNNDTLLNTNSICSGIYTLKLVDTAGCKNEYTEIIQDGPIPPTQEICLITVDNMNTHNLLVWDRTNMPPAVDSFIIYREITTNNYSVVGTVSKDSISTFDDYLADPSTTGYRYKLSTKNAMNVESNLSDYHNTIYLTNNGANFNWTPYQVQNASTPVASYNVYRDDNSDGNFNLIGNTTGNQFGFTDVQFLYFTNASYYVTAVMSSGDCNPTRSFTGAHSNTKYTGSGTTEINQINNNNSITIYPNPAKDVVSIDGIVKVTVVQLYDIVGRLIIENEIENNLKLDISQLKNGVYNIVINNTSTKLIINN